MAERTERTIDRSVTQEEDGILARRAEGRLTTGEPLSIEATLDRAIQAGMAPEALEKVIALYERVQAMRAKQAFAEAMARFKDECPAVPRRSVSQFEKTVVGKDGRPYKTPRLYAALQDIESTIGSHLSNNGLSFRWGDAEPIEGGKFIRVACIITHVGGHSESSTAIQPVESSAGCSPSQKMGSAETYAMRYSLIRALGLTTCDEDDDGNGPQEPAQRITAHQAADLKVAVENVKGNLAGLLKRFKVATVEELDVEQHREALAMVEEKRRAQK